MTDALPYCPPSGGGEIVPVGAGAAAGGGGGAREIAMSQFIKSIKQK